MALMAFKNNIDWYQSKIGDHDKQYWEQSVDGKILNSIDSLPKRDVIHTEQNRELLDIDLIKGSTFTKAAPSHTSYMRTWIGLVKILFLPFYYRWWIKHTTWKFFAGILVLYASQIFVTSVYYFHLPKSSSSTSAVLLFEITNPLMFMFVLSVIHTQIVYTQASARNHQIFKKTSATSTATVSSSSKRPGTVKRSKKAKPNKRKPKSTSSNENIGKQVADRLKISSDSSEGVEDMLLGETRTYMDTDILDDCDEEGSVCSVEDDGSGRPTISIDAVPDVAADAEERSAGSSPRRTPAQQPHSLRLPSAVSDSLLNRREGRGESEGTSDLDSPTKHCTSDTEWENNRVCNSDVAQSSSDSSSEYMSDAQDDEPSGVEGPISLKRKLSHSLTYVPSFYDRITCIVWEKGQCKKVDLSVVEIGGHIEREVSRIDYDSGELLYSGVIFTLLIAAFPFLFRLYYNEKLRQCLSHIVLERTIADWNSTSESMTVLFGNNWQETSIILNGVMQRLFLCGLFCFLVLVAEKAYWQRLQYAKYFCYLTSARRSRKHCVPHFRLNKVKNIKIWLSLRAYLKKRGPQRSVEVIVGAVFMLLIVFLGCMCVQLLSDIEGYIRYYGNWELTLCCAILMCYLLKFYSLGTKITKKYRNLSTIITEQINLYLHMEQKPQKKEELLVANAVLKLAEGLIKEIESPYKMSTAMINPVIFNVTRVAMLSAFSAVVSELLGFKLKLYKVKL